jgi:TPR repeat protein
MAQSNLEVLYEKGWGVPQDYAKARQWYEKAAAQGNAGAQTSLGDVYAQGQGVPQDYAIARQWLEKAAAQGDVMAQYKLGFLYVSGRGVPQDHVLAYMWSSLAAAHSTGDVQKSSANNRDVIASRMTPAQLAEAQGLAQQCQAKQFKGC